MPTGNRVVDRALEAHGTEARFSRLAALHTTWTFRGMMFKLRLREASLRRLRATISTREPRVEVSPFPGPEGRGVFLPNRVEVQGPRARVLDAPRDAFRSPRSLLWWNDVEMLYFAGYVLWNYAQLPFLLLQPGLTLTDAGSTTLAGERCDKVVVDFPTGFPTHSPRQTFYFSSEHGLLRRHDYWVGIMSRLAKGARYIHAYQQVDGLTLPSRIEMRLGTFGDGYLPLLSLGFVDFDDTSVS
jgi:hypothetical protein